MFTCCRERRRSTKLASVRWKVFGECILLGKQLHREGKGGGEDRREIRKGESAQPTASKLGLTQIRKLYPLDIFLISCFAWKGRDGCLFFVQHLLPLWHCRSTWANVEKPFPFLSSWWLLMRPHCYLYSCNLKTLSAFISFSPLCFYLSPTLLLNFLLSRKLSS